MIDRLSFSSLKCYLNDKQQFHKQYILGQWDDMNDAVYVGKAVHRMIEAHLTGEMVPLAHDALAYEAAELLKQKKTLADVDAAKKETQTAYDSFLEYITHDGAKMNPVSVEGKYEVFPEMMPFYLKGFMDVVAQDPDGRVTVIDRKNTKRFTPEGGTMAHRLQAVFYVMLLEATDATPSYRAEFVEIHRAKRAYRVHTYNIEPNEVEAMRDLCALAYDEIVNNKNHFLPNPFSMFGGDKAWQYFVASRSEE